MRCKACNGTGYVAACVYESDEIGFVDKNYECAVCHGTGQIEQTNEEWFCSLSTEAKAIWLEEKMTQAAQEQGTFTAKGWVKWLKQPHNNEEQ